MSENCSACMKLNITKCHRLLMSKSCSTRSHVKGRKYFFGLLLCYKFLEGIELRFILRLLVLQIQAAKLTANFRINPHLRICPPRICLHLKITFANKPPSNNPPRGLIRRMHGCRIISYVKKPHSTIARKYCFL